MTWATETKAPYERLREHYLADGKFVLPQRKEVVQILELRFTPEEAQLALSIPMTGQGRLSLESLAEKVGREKTEVWSMLESLLSKGILYMERNLDDGQEAYCLWDFYYSTITPLFGDGLIDDVKRKVAELRDRIWDAGYSYLWFNSTYPLSRVMPYEPMLDPAAQVADYERYSHFVNKAQEICVVACGCRMSVSRCKDPVWTCMHFGRGAEYWIKYRRGHTLTKGEALQQIEEAVREGLVVTGANDQEMPIVFCHCCRDCCVLLRPYIEKFNTNSFARSNFMPHWDLEKCKICTTCQKACPVGAIGRHLSHEEGERDHVIVMPDRCIGCGVCAAVCPREAITLKRVRDAVPEPTRKQADARHKLERIW